MRVSYVQNGNNLQIMDRNDYYPFGMSFLKPFGQVSVYDPMAIPYNYKYNQKELQETGFYDYGWRQYMPDVGRWFGIDPLAEQMRRHIPYNYGFNNPIKFIDPDGRRASTDEFSSGNPLGKNSVPPIDYVNEKGNKIGTDGTDVKGTLMITNKNDQKAITNAEKNGQHIGTDQLSELNIGMVVPPDSTLKESLAVIARGDANGGFREESSSIEGDGVVTRGETGPLPTVGADGVATAPASLTTNARTHTTIHLHPAGIFEKNGQIYPFDALTPTANDISTFAGKGINIIVGRLGLGKNANITQNPNGTFNDPRPVGAAIYRGGNISNPMKLTIPVIKNILNRNAN